jgi:hypothetical protein
MDMKLNREKKNVEEVASKASLSLQNVTRNLTAFSHKSIIYYLISSLHAIMHINMSSLAWNIKNLKLNLFTTYNIYS